MEYDTTMSIHDVIEIKNLMKMLNDSANLVSDIYLAYGWVKFLRKWVLRPFLMLVVTTEILDFEFEDICVISCYSLCTNKKWPKNWFLTFRLVFQEGRLRCGGW